jgi:hypothetical protein
LRARNLHGARILVVGTYRNVEVDRAHPLSAALGQLHRASNYARIHLRGLSMNEVQRVLGETSQHTIPQPVAELVQRQTDGNPLFVDAPISVQNGPLYGQIARRDANELAVDDALAHVMLIGRLCRDAVRRTKSLLVSS